MTRYTLRQLKQIANSATATDITDASSYDAIPEPFAKIGYSRGMYGLNGLLLKGSKTGTLYVIAGRSTAIFIFA